MTPQPTLDPLSTLIQLNGMLIVKYDAVEARLNGIDDRLDKVEGRLSTIETGIKDIKKMLEAMSK